MDWGAEWEDGLNEMGGRPSCGSPVDVDAEASPVPEPRYGHTEAMLICVGSGRRGGSLCDFCSRKLSRFAVSLMVDFESS